MSLMAHILVAPIERVTIDLHRGRELSFEVALDFTGNSSGVTGD